MHAYTRAVGRELENSTSKRESQTTFTYLWTNITTNRSHDDECSQGKTLDEGIAQYNKVLYSVGLDYACHLIEVIFFTSTMKLKKINDFLFGWLVQSKYMVCNTNKNTNTYDRGRHAEFFALLDIFLNIPQSYIPKSSQHPWEVCAHIVYLGRDEGPGVQKGEIAFLEDGAKIGWWEWCPTQHQDAKF